MEFIDNFNTSTKLAFSLLSKADSPPGFVMLLPRLLHELSEDSFCKPAMKTLSEELNQQDLDLKEHKLALVKWMREKVEILKKQKCFEHQTVKLAIENLEQILSGKRVEIVFEIGYYGVVLSAFSEACRTICAYGNSPDFHGWMSVKHLSETIMYSQKADEGSFFSHPREQEEIVLPDSEKAALLIKRRGGFVKATISPGYKTFDGGIGLPRFTYEIGALAGIHYPQSQAIWKSRLDIERLQCMDDRADNLLRFIKILSEFKDLKPEPLSLASRESFIEADMYSDQQLRQLYLSKYKNRDWNKVPMTKHDLVKCIERLLIFLHLESIKPLKKDRGARSGKTEASEFIQGLLQAEWKKYNGKTPKNYQSMRTAVLKGLRTASQEIQATASDTLREREISKFAKSKKMKTKRGPDRGKRHVI